jgi:hypothetical protein
MTSQRAASKRNAALLIVAGWLGLYVAPLDVIAAPPAPTRNQILGSPAWRQAMEGLDEWFSVQAIYEKSEVPRVRAWMAGKIDKMSAGQLQFFLQDMQQKLSIINSPAAYKAQANVLYNLNVASNAYAAKLRMMLPNLVTMTADQVQQTLFDLQQQENDTRADEAAFQQSNAQEISLIQAQNRQTAEANAAAEAEMSSSGGNYGGGLYTPQVSMPQYNPAPIVTGFYGWPW